MAQNRNRLIKRFTGNLSNSIIHEILEKAINDEDIRKKYDKESTISLKIAMKYRKKINPTGTSLPEKDVKYIREDVVKKVRSELRSRIAKGYLNIDISSVDKIVDKFLKNLKVS